ncbi:MAG: hypothetical protein COA90_06715 [Gammaproteobacteria bacterium]|nr:MAG: hypothetical protein COA90_06715 [Gammaproteobacteria bacterium]
MPQNSKHVGNVIMLRGACLWILMALLLAWVLVGLYNEIEILSTIFPGSPRRVLQAHLDFLIMSALILGFYAAKVSLPWHVRWAMVIGAFTNSSLFLMYALFPSLDPVHETFNPIGFAPTLFEVYLYASLVTTSYGFGKAAVLVFKSTFSEKTS